MVNHLSRFDTVRWLKLATIAGTMFLLGSLVYVDPSFKLAIQCALVLAVLACLVQVGCYRHRISWMYTALPQARRDQIQLVGSCITLFVIIWWPLSEPAFFALFVLVFGLEHIGYAVLLGGLASALMAIVVVAYWARSQRNNVGTFVRLALGAWGIGLAFHAAAVVMDEPPWES